MDHEGNAAAWRAAPLLRPPCPCGPYGQPLWATPAAPLTHCILAQACDQLIGLEMVDYRGRLVKANRWHNSNLLRAACGCGGGNFGEEAASLFPKCSSSSARKLSVHIRLLKRIR